MIKKINTVDGWQIFEENSIFDLADLAFNEQVATSEKNRQFINNNLRKHLTGKDEWANYYQPQTLLKDLFCPPTEKYTQAVLALKEQIQIENPAFSFVAVRRRQRRYAETGDEIDADRYLSHNPAFWQRIERVPVEKPVVKIGVNLAADWSRKPEDLLWRGAAILALADRLSASGYSVQIDALLAVGNLSRRAKANDCLVVIRLKESDKPLDLNTLVFPVCEIAFMRCIVVHALARLKDGEITTYLGRPAFVIAPIRKNYDYIMENNLFGRADALAWLAIAGEKIKGNHV